MHPLSALILSLLAIVLARMAASLLGLAGPYPLQFLIDAVFQQNDPRLLDRITLILVAIFAMRSVF